MNGTKKVMKGRRRKMTRKMCMISPAPNQTQKRRARFIGKILSLSLGSVLSTVEKFCLFQSILHVIGVKRTLYRPADQENTNAFLGRKAFAGCVAPDFILVETPENTRIREEEGGGRRQEGGGRREENRGKERRGKERKGKERKGEERSRLCSEEACRRS
jgi:hypothetical protein